MLIQYLPTWNQFVSSSALWVINQGGQILLMAKYYSSNITSFTLLFMNYGYSPLKFD